MPSMICLTVMAGFHASSSFRIDRQTVPDGYTLGWNSGGTNLPIDNPVSVFFVLFLFQQLATYTLEV